MNSMSKADLRNEFTNATNEIKELRAEINTLRLQVQHSHIAVERLLTLSELLARNLAK